MLYQPIKLNLILDIDKLPILNIGKIRGVKIYLKIDSKKELSNIVKMMKMLDIDGIYLRLNNILNTDLVRKLTEINSFKILLHIDKSNISRAIKEYINSLTYIHEIIPIIDIFRSIESISLINLPTIDSIIINYKPPKYGKRVNINIIDRNVTYIRDCLNRILRNRHIVLGSILSKIDIKIYEKVKDLILLSSSIYIYNSIKDILVLQDILDKTNTSQIYNILTQLYLQGDVKVEVNIE